MRLFTLIFASLLTSCGQQKTDLTEKARQIHDRILTLDTHDDINVKYFTDTLNYSMDTKTQVNLHKMREGGLDVAWFIVYTGQGELTEQGYKKAADNAQAKFDAIHLSKRVCPQ